MVIKKISEDLTALGIRKGDTVCIRADLGKINLPFKKKTDYIDSILDAVGEEGTIIGLSFTAYNFIKKSKENFFDGKNKAITGAFANLMLSHPDAIRSSHPTNSYVAIGKNAEYLTKDHNENAGAFDPMRKLIELDAKMLLIGCTSTNPGFTTTHLVETELNLHNRFMLQGYASVYYKKDGELKLFIRKDSGCCSIAHYRLYGYYIQNEFLRQGYVGDAYSIMINARKSYQVEKEFLTKHPKLLICGNKDCIKCNLRWDNFSAVPGFLVRNLNKIIAKKFKR